MKPDEGGPCEMEIVMLSRLRTIDGGRETWIAQFAPRFFQQTARPIVVNSICDGADPEAIDFGRSALVHSVWRGPRFAPWGILFVLGYVAAAVLRPASQRRTVVAVGGVAEALAVLLADAVTFRRRRKTLWLRTVYSREKSTRLGPLLTRAAVWVESWMVKGFDNIVANGHDTADYYRRFRSDIVVIENAVDTSRWAGAVRPYEGGPLHVGYIGRITRIKGAFEFYTAARRLRQADPDGRRFRFIAVGPVGEAERSALDMDEPACPVEYLGPVPNAQLGPLLKQMDVCANLTYGTGDFMGGGVSNALLEQLAAGKPQVVWDSPVYRNVVAEDCAAFAVEKDVDSLVARLEYLWERRSQISLMTDAARRTAERYSWDTHIEKARHVICGGM